MAVGEVLTPHHRQIRLRAAVVPRASLWWRGPRLPERAALTFDDGPLPGETEAVLEVLAEAGVRATFFLLVGLARDAPRLARQIALAGHEVGVHGEDHVRLDRLSITRLTASLAQWKAELEDLTNAPVRLHRPPYGRLSWRSLAAAADVQLQPVLWSHDPLDWHRPAAGPDGGRRLAGAISASLVPGAIVLLHDGVQSFPHQGRLTAGALEAVLTSGRPRPELVPVSELCDGRSAVAGGEAAGPDRPGSDDRPESD